MAASGRQSLPPSHSPGSVLVDPSYLHNLAAAIRAANYVDLARLVWTRFDLAQLDRLPREGRMAWELEPISDDYVQLLRLLMKPLR